MAVQERSEGPHRVNLVTNMNEARQKKLANAYKKMEKIKLFSRQLHCEI